MEQRYGGKILADNSAFALSALFAFNNGSNLCRGLTGGND